MLSRQEVDCFDSISRDIPGKLLERKVQPLESGMYFDGGNNLRGLQEVTCKYTFPEPLTGNVVNSYIESVGIPTLFDGYSIIFVEPIPRKNRTFERRQAYKGNYLGYNDTTERKPGISEKELVYSDGQGKLFIPLVDYHLWMRKGETDSVLFFGYSIS